VDNKLKFCSHCGHLSRPRSGKCHNCSSELKSAGRSVEFLTSYYDALESGYGKYSLIGLLFIIQMPFTLFVLSAVAFLIQMTGGSLSPTFRTIAIGSFVVSTVGFILYTGCFYVLTDNINNISVFDSVPRIFAMLIYGTGFTLLIYGISAVLLIIPIVNILAFLGIAFGYGYLVVVTWRSYKRNKVDLVTAVSSLVAADGTLISSKCIDLLFRGSETTTAIHRNILVEFLENSPSTVHDFVTSHRMLPETKSMYADDGADKEKLLEIIFTAGEKQAARNSLSASLDCFRAVEELAEYFNLDSYVDKARTEADLKSDLITVNQYVNAQITSELADTAQNREEVINELFELGQEAREKGEFEKANQRFEAAENLACDHNMSEYLEAAEVERSETETQIQLAEFENQVDELFDIVQSAERAVDDGQYQKALQRFRTANDRLPPELLGQGPLQESHTELVHRVEDGFSKAGRHYLLSLLPESPTPLEKELLTLAVPEIIGETLTEIYEDTLPVDDYRTLIQEEHINSLSTAGAVIETYRKCRVKISNAVSQSNPYLSTLDATIEQSVAEGVEHSSQGREETEINSIPEINNESEFHGNNDDGHIRVVEEAVSVGAAFSESLASLVQAEKKCSSPSVASCLQAIQNVLLEDDRLRSKDAFQELEDVVESLEEVDSYVTAFPTLSIDSIVEDMTVAIQDGALIQLATFSNEFERINRLVEQEINGLATEIEAFLNKWEGHPAVNHGEWRRAVSRARETADPQPLLGPYSTMQEMQGAMWTQKGLQQFSWSAFEQLIANLYEQQGYETTVTPGSNDRGVDVWAENDLERVAIQVKQFAEGNVVGRPVIQKLESTLARGDADRIVIITSSTFANTAKQYAAESTNVELIDGDELITQLTKFDVPTAKLESK
jgi:tetratricopeptide (TPR) repeat protein